MLCWIADLAMVIFGIVAIAKGSFTLSRGRVTRGAPARIVGVVLIVGSLLSFASSFAYALILSAQVMSEKPNATQQEVVKEVEAHSGTLLAIQGGTTGGTLVVAIIIAFATAVPAKAARRRPMDDDEDLDELDEDRPLRPRDRDKDDESDDRFRPRPLT